MSDQLIVGDEMGDEHKDYSSTDCSYRLTEGMKMKIDDLPWSNISERTFLGAGGYGVVFEVAPGIAVKMGDIEPYEAMAQRCMAHLEKAVPVLEYAPRLALPSKICRYLCGMHGYRMIWGGCSCHERKHDVLLMPKALEASCCGWTDLDKEAFADEIDQLSFFRLGRPWARDLEAIMCYKEHLVALDFGIP